MFVNLEAVADSLPFASGRSKREQEADEYKQKRLDNYRKWADPSGELALMNESQLEVLIDLGLKEAALRPDFDPDLLLVTEMQYRMMFSIPISVPLCPDESPYGGSQTEELKQHVPPKSYQTDAGRVDVVYSEEADRILLLDSTLFETA